MQQLHPEIFLEVGDAATHRRLGEAQARRRYGEALGLDDSDEHGNRTDIESHIVEFRSTICS